MDRHSNKHRDWRVELPASLRQPPGSTASAAAAPFGSKLRPRLLASKLGEVLGLVGFLSGGVAVIATASLLALQVH